MKKFLLLAAISFVFITTSEAQSNGNWSNKSNQSQWQGRNGQGQLAKLNLTQAQKDQMKQLSEDMQAQRKTIMDDNALTQDQKKEKMADLRKTRQDKMATILTPDQLKQLSTTQYGNRGGKKGVKPGNRKAMNKSGKKQGMAGVNLTQDQKDKMEAIRRDAATQRKAINDDQSLTKEQKAEKMKTLNTDMRSQMSNILTAEQKEQLKSSMDQQKVNNKGKFGKAKKG